MVGWNKRVGKGQGVVSTRERIAVLYQGTPELSLAEIGRRVGVSKQRVHQIISGTPAGTGLPRGPRRKHPNLPIPLFQDYTLEALAEALPYSLDYLIAIRNQRIAPGRRFRSIAAYFLGRPEEELFAKAQGNPQEPRKDPDPSRLLPSA